MGNMSDPEKQRMASMVGLALFYQSRVTGISWKEVVHWDDGDARGDQQ